MLAVNGKASSRIARDAALADKNPVMSPKACAGVICDGLLAMKAYSTVLPAALRAKVGPSGQSAVPPVRIAQKIARTYPSSRWLVQKPAGENAVTLAALPRAASSRQSRPPSEDPPT